MLTVRVFDNVLMAVAEKVHTVWYFNVVMAVRSRMVDKF